MIIKAKANHSYIFINKKLKQTNTHFRKDLINVTSYQLEENGQSVSYCLIKKTKKGNYRIPLGLLSKIEPVFEKHKIKLVITYPPKEDIDYIDLDDGFNGCLRRYQLRAYLRGLKYERGIFHHATGAGKTITMSSLIFGTLYFVFLPLLTFFLTYLIRFTFIGIFWIDKNVIIFLLLFLYCLNLNYFPFSIIFHCFRSVYGFINPFSFDLISYFIPLFPHPIIDSIVILIGIFSIPLALSCLRISMKDFED